jgi:hypothetical protein
MRGMRGISAVTFAAAAMSFAFAAPASGQTPPRTRGSTGALPPVVVDGRFGDWDGIPAAAVGRGVAGAGSPVRLREVRVRHDAGNVFLYFDFGRQVVPQGLAGTVEVLLDVDGDAATGHTVDGLPGADVAVLLSPRVRGSSGAVSTVGIGVARLTGVGSVDSAQLLPADTAGVIVAPSYASPHFELRMARGATVADGPPLFTGGRFAAKVVALDPAGAKAAETGVFTHPLTAGPERPTPVGAGEADPLARAPGTAFRLLSWNVNGKGFIEHPDPFRRAIAALRPDVILLDEMLPEARATVDSLLASLPAPAGAGPWHVVYGEAGGRQRGVVASRLPLELARGLDRVPYPDSTTDVLRGAPASVAADVSVADGVPTVGALVTVDGRRILLATVDLKCCGGGMGTPEERIRGIEARAMQDAVQRAAAQYRPDGVVIAGDFNLVGTATPLQTLRGRRDAFTFDRAVADAPRLEGLSYATWMRPRNLFAPGRLDYHLYSGRTLRVARSFAFDAADLSPRWLGAHGLRAGDSVDASGHRPVVTDFAWAPAPR